MRVLRHALDSSRQSGAATVEFAIIAVVFFVIWLGIMELGRMMYIWNTAQEITRRAARMAVVNWMDQQDAVQRTAVFQPGSSGTVYVPAGGEISNAQIEIAYLQADAVTPVSPAPSGPNDNLSACADATRTASCIRYVRARICDTSTGSCNALSYSPMVSLLGNLGINLAVNIPLSAAVMPAESLGYAP